MKKIIIVVSLVLMAFVSKKIDASSYNYNHTGPRESAEGYTVANTIYSSSIASLATKDQFANLQEVQVYGDFVYILDSKNKDTDLSKSNRSRIFVFDHKFNLQRMIDSYYEFEKIEEIPPVVPETKAQEYNEDVRITSHFEVVTTPMTKEQYEAPTPEGYKKITHYFNQAQGFFVTNDRIYVADTENQEVVVLKLDGELDFIVGTPKDDIFKDVKFLPLKISVDSGKRIYVIAKNVYQGIIQLNKFGEFEMYTGVNKVVVSPLELIWRKFYTEEQLKRIKLYLPREFTNLTVDDKNFIYAAAKATANTTDALIKCINPSGKDVLKKNGYAVPSGDIQYLTSSGSGISKVILGPSNFVSLTVNDYGLYTALDNNRGRLFTYNNEGHLLYISGHLGQQNDALGTPVSVKYLNNDLIVLDQSNNSIIVYQETASGKLINEASKLHRNGFFEEAAIKWLEVIKLNSNYQMAYNHIGKLILNDDTNEVIKLINPDFDGNLKIRYKTAMNYFDLGKDMEYYSEAYKQYRTIVLKENFELIMVGILIVSVGITGVFIYKKRKNHTYKEEE